MENPAIEILLAAMIWGTTGVFIKYLNLPPTTINFFRLAIPAIFLYIFLKAKRVKLWNINTNTIIFISAINAIRLLLYFYAYTLTSIGNALIILYTWPIFASIFGFIILKEKMNLRKVSFLFLAFTGIVVTFSGSSFSLQSKDFIGMGAMLVSAVLYALTIPLFKKELEKCSNYEAVFYQNFIGAFIFLPFFLFSRPWPHFWQFNIAIIYAFLIGIIGFSLFFAGLKRLSTTASSLLTYAEVISGLVFGWIFFRQPITIEMVIGGILILLSSYFIRISEKII